MLLAQQNRLQYLNPNALTTVHSYSTGVVFNYATMKKSFFFKVKSLIKGRALYCPQTYCVAIVCGENECKDAAHTGNGPAH